MRIFDANRKKKKHKTRRANDNFRESVLKVNTRALDGRALNARRIGTGVLAGTGFALAVLLAYFVFMTLGGALFFNNDLFILRRIEIDIGGNVLGRELVLNRPALKNCSNIFEINLKKFKQEFLKDYPRVKSMEIKRKLPGTLLINITERTPIARLEMPGHFLDVDQEAKVLGGRRGTAGLPVIQGHPLLGSTVGISLKGTVVMDAVEIIDARDSIRAGDTIKIHSIDVRDRNRIKMILDGGEQITIAWKGQGSLSDASRKNLESKLKMLDKNIRAAGQRGERIEWIDMTFENNFPAGIR